MLKKYLSALLALIIVLNSCFILNASGSESNNMIIVPATVTTLKAATTADERAASWTKTGSGTAEAYVDNGLSVVHINGYKGAQLFTNTFTLEKNYSYKISFEVKIGSDTKLSSTYSGVTNPEGIDFVIQDFGSLDKNGVASYRSYIEGATDYAHAYKGNGNKKRVKTSLVWTLESDTDSPYIYSVTKYSPFGKYIGTSNSPIAALKTVDLEDFYSDWRTVTCEIKLPDEDEYTASDIAIGFSLPYDGTELYVRGVTMKKIIPEIPDNTIPVSVVDLNGNPHSSGDDIPFTSHAANNGDGTYSLSIDYDSMDGVNEFLGWYSGETLLSNEQNYTTGKGMNFESISAKILCKSVITGGLGFESYKTETSMRVDNGVHQALPNTPPFDDKWGQMYETYQQSDDWVFLIKATNGDYVTKYATAYNPSVDKKFETDTTIVKPYSGDSMMYYGTRARSVVRKLDNLKPNTEYELSFYVYNLSEWDFLHTATIADAYEMEVGNTVSDANVKVYDYYKEIYKRINDVYVRIADTSKVFNWNKITLNFTTDEDDSFLYLHLYSITGRNVDDTSKTFIDNLTVTEIPRPQSFEECVTFKGNAMRKGTYNSPEALRFKFELNEHIYNLYENQGYSLSECGALVAYEKMVSGSPIVLEDGVKNGRLVTRGVAYNKADNINRLARSTDDSFTVSFALHNIGGGGKEINYEYYNKDILLRPYAIYKNAEGEELVCYAETEKASLFDLADSIVSGKVTDNKLAQFGINSTEYAGYLSDLLTVRNILSDSKVKDAYFASGRSEFTSDSTISGIVETVELGEDISIHTERQTEFLNVTFDMDDDYGANVWDYVDGTEELSRPLPVRFSWSSNYNGNGAFYGYLLTLSKNSDLSDPKVYSLNDTSLEVYNLNIGTDYYWNVSAVYSNGIFTSATDKFSISDVAPRNLYVEGVTNVRDLGGWKVGDKTIKQGVVYRMGNLNDITEEGKRTLIEDLGLKAELDLRIKGEAVEVFYKSDNVKYYDIPMSSTYCLQYNSEEIVKAFEILGDESNYPIAIHCSIGTDRTGMMAFVLNGLLGASDDQLNYDYLFSLLGDIGTSRNLWDLYLYRTNHINRCKGDTFAERTYNYLLKIGVKAEHIDTAIRMMTE